MVFRYPALATQLASTSSAGHSAHRSPAPPLRGFRKQPPAAVAPGYLLKGRRAAKAPGRELKGSCALTSRKLRRPR
jgi:hypothetical protein